ncbi:MAG: hypothetical protein KKD77_22980 [Gammaproteobacteria bacterium]|nr:hypothetical protein [Gammaproteobacteria bacterium]
MAGIEEMLSAGPEGTGPEGIISNLFQNKMFLQLLAGLGLDLSAFGADTGKGFQPTNLTGGIQQNIQSQNFMKMLQKFLGPDESKATLSNKGITMSVPGSDLGSIFQGTQKGGVWEGMASPLGAPKMGTGGAAAVNPFVSSQPDMNVSPADLAGLTPSDIATALGARQTQEKMGLEKEQLASKSVQDVFNMMFKVIEDERAAAAAEVDIPYKRTLIRESEARAKKIGEPDPLDQPHPFSIPKSDGTPMTVREFNTLTPRQKERFEYLNEVSKGTGKSMLEDMSALTEAQTPPPTSFREWKAARDVSGYTDSYEQWKTDPSDWYEYKRAKSEGGFVGNYAQWKEHLATISQREREPAPMTWTTATQELTKRYGKLDPTGMWAVTPELQSTHRKAQTILNEYRESKMHPLKAINEAESAANAWKIQIEKKYQEYIDKAGGNKDMIAKINSAFYNKYGYLPTLRK